MSVRVREARPDEYAAAMSVLDAAMLETGDVRERIPGDVLVAVDGEREAQSASERVSGERERGATGGSAAETRTASGASRERSDPRASRVLGALVLDGGTVEAVAVRPGRRGQGIGTALVAAAGDRRDRLVAEFDADLRPFYEGLGFEVEPAGDGRLRGVYRG